MAKITIIITDDKDGTAKASMIIDHDFEADGVLTPAQEAAMSAMCTIYEDGIAEIIGDEDALTLLAQ